MLERGDEYTAACGYLRESDAYFDRMTKNILLSTIQQTIAEERTKRVAARFGLNFEKLLNAFFSSLDEMRARPERRRPIEGSEVARLLGDDLCLRRRPGVDSRPAYIARVGE